MTNYDQRHQQVGTQYNINIDASQSADVEALLNQGINFLEARSYPQSINLFNEVIKADASIAVAYYYLAIALLKGRRPKILKRSEVEEIDQLLVSAVACGDSDATVHWFRALVRDDYYGGNRMNCPPPSVQTILASIQANTTKLGRLRSLLAKLPMADNAMYSRLFKEIS
jgi:hypothetical protein